MNLALSQKGSKLLAPYFIGKQGDIGPGMFFAKPVIRGVVDPHDAPFRRVDARRQAWRINRNRVAAVQSGLGKYLSCLGVIGRHNNQRIGMLLSEGLSKAQYFLKLLYLAN